MSAFGEPGEVPDVALHAAREVRALRRRQRVRRRHVDLDPLLARLPEQLRLFRRAALFPLEEPVAQLLRKGVAIAAQLHQLQELALAPQPLLLPGALDRGRPVADGDDLLLLLVGEIAGPFLDLLDRALGALAALLLGAPV